MARSFVRFVPEWELPKRRYNTLEGLQDTTALARLRLAPRCGLRGPSLYLDCRSRDVFQQHLEDKAADGSPLVFCGLAYELRFFSSAAYENG
jgi:hypothetical protein